MQKITEISNLELKAGASVSIIYHRVDNDGRASAAIIREYCLEHDIEPMLFPWTYGDPLPYVNTEGNNSLNNSVVFLVDLCLEPWTEMVRLAFLAKHVVWMDHHTSSVLHWNEEGSNLEEALKGRMTAILNIEKAACETVWAFVHPEETPPSAIAAIGLYDTFGWGKNTAILEFVRGLEIEDTRVESELWRKLIRGEAKFAKDIAKRGAAILAYQGGRDLQVLASSSFPVIWRDLHLLAINTSGNSLLFEASKYAAQIHAGMCFVWKRSGWNVSLYRPRTSQMPPVDLSMVAFAMGGGGHRGAAGFLARQISFTPIDTPLFPELGQTYTPLFQR